jgi:DNA-binding beta-propeller fold protein YncE
VTALLVLMVLIGSVVAFSGRWGPQEDAPAILSAISGTPAAPERATGPGVKFVWQISKAPGQHFIELGRPAIDPEGNLWVPDAAFDQYQIFAPDGTYLESWGASGSGEGEFDFSCSDIPYGSIAFDASGAFYVLDSGNDRIQKFGPDRTFLTSWGSDGSAEDQFTCPAVIAVDQQGRVYVSDREADKVVVFDGEGTWLDTWPTPPGPSGLAVDGDGNIWVVGYENESVSKFSQDGELLVTWEESAERAFIGPGFVAIDAQGRVFVSEHDGARVQVFTPNGALLGSWGEYGAGEGEFMEPRGIALDGQGGAYVTEWAGNRVQKFQLLPPLVGPLTP